MVPRDRMLLPPRVARASDRGYIVRTRTKETPLEFLQFDRAWQTLTREEVVTLSGESPADLDTLQIDYDERRTAHRTVFANKPDHEIDVVDAETLSVPREKAGEVLEHILHKLHLAPLLILPIGKWRPVFDLITNALMENEQWMAIDAEATIELNTRDPLMCEPRDLHLLKEMVNVILRDGEEMPQGISIAAVQSPILVEVEPAGGILLTIGNEGLADEVRAVANAFVSD
ncbi:hypothetical protein OAL71_00305 [Phycisphaerales bacterium]|nr:hypothetical protein [Phycisphaerales bacterium]